LRPQRTLALAAVLMMSTVAGAGESFDQIFDEVLTH
jgi:hypothetical protein